VADEEEEEAKPSVVTSKHVSLQLVVPRHAVGAVIGQQGAQIKQVLSQRERIIIQHMSSVGCKASVKDTSNIINNTHTTTSWPLYKSACQC